MEWDWPQLDLPFLRVDLLLLQNIHSSNRRDKKSLGTLCCRKQRSVQKELKFCHLCWFCVTQKHEGADKLRANLNPLPAGSLDVASTVMQPPTMWTFCRYYLPRSAILSGYLVSFTMVLKGYSRHKNILPNLSFISSHTLGVKYELKINCKAMNSAVLLFLVSQPEQRCTQKGSTRFSGSLKQCSTISWQHRLTSW